MNKEIVIVGAARTPMGGLLGVLKDVSAIELGKTALSAAVERAELKPEQIEEVIMGCVLPAGLGQAPARQVALNAGLSLGTDCTTINKMCGSGMKAIMLACNTIAAGDHTIVAAGGMESMSNAPYLLPKVRSGLRSGHAQLVDHMLYDGLEDAFEKGRLMGVFAENCAQQYHFTRVAQDEFAITSLTRAQNAIQSGAFAAEITPVHWQGKTGEVLVCEDEQPLRAKIEKIPTLKPAFVKGGTITAANASSISDGAACVILTSLAEAKAQHLKPLAKIVGFTTHSQAPEWFTTAPIEAIRKLLTQIQWQVEEVDLFEVNEAFAVVAMAARDELAIPADKLNIHGGACALGHPVGASGARIMVTLLYALQQQGLKRGVAALCIGGGEATAMAIEIV